MRQDGRSRRGRINTVIALDLSDGSRMRRSPREHSGQKTGFYRGNAHPAGLVPADRENNRADVPYGAAGRADQSLGRLVSTSNGISKQQMPGTRLTLGPGIYDERSLTEVRVIGSRSRII
jgi:hypothetical protein